MFVLKELQSSSIISLISVILGLKTKQAVNQD